MVSEKVIKHEWMLFVLVELGKDALAAKNLRITYHQDPCLYISFREIMFVMNQAVDTFLKNDEKPALSHAIFFYQHVRALLDELQLFRLEQEKKRLPTFAMFLDTNIRKKEISFRSIMSLLINYMRPFSYDEGDKPKNGRRRQRCGRNVFH